jgi:hypothetical protein
VPSVIDEVLTDARGVVKGMYRNKTGLYDSSDEQAVCIGWLIEYRGIGIG